jgi:hypothetical protein
VGGGGACTTTKFGPRAPCSIFMDHKGTFSRRSGDEGTPSSTGKAPYLRPGCVVCGKETKNRCTACDLVRYCSKECQKQHWPVHKQTCPCGPTASRQRRTACERSPQPPDHDQWCCYYYGTCVARASIVICTMLSTGQSTSRLAHRPTAGRRRRPACERTSPQPPDHDRWCCYCNLYNVNRRFYAV